MYYLDFDIFIDHQTTPMKHQNSHLSFSFSGKTKSSLSSSHFV